MGYKCLSSNPRGCHCCMVSLHCGQIYQVNFIKLRQNGHCLITMSVHVIIADKGRKHHIRTLFHFIPHFLNRLQNSDNAKLISLNVKCTDIVATNVTFEHILRFRDYCPNGAHCKSHAMNACNSMENKYVPYFIFSSFTRNFFLVR